MSAEETAGRPLAELARHTLVYGSGYISVAVVSLVLIPVYTHQLSPSQFGLLALMLVLYGLMKQVYDLGFMNSVGRFFFDYKGDRGRGGPAPDAGHRPHLPRRLRRRADRDPLDLRRRPGRGCSRAAPEHGELVRIVAVTLYAEALRSFP